LSTLSVISLFTRFSSWFINSQSYHESRIYGEGISLSTTTLRLPLLAAFLITPALPQSPIWPQWAQNPQHTGDVSVIGQAMNRNLVNLVYDPLVPSEQAANGGELLAHYQAPLVDGDDIFMMFKSGTYNVHQYSTQKWGENRFTWVNGNLVQQWSYLSDWSPPGSAIDFWEPVFHPLLSGQFVYVPGSAGSIVKLNRSNGSVAATIQPFPDWNQNRFSASPLTVDSAGNVYYNVVQIQSNADFFSQDVVDSWIVKVTASGTATKASYPALLPNAPKGTDLCLATFSNSQLPWPPSPTAIPPSVTCGTQRAGLNVAPAVAPDGTIYSVTRAHLISRYGYLVSIKPDLTLKWAASLRDRFHDGCRATLAGPGNLPVDGTPGGCRVGANPGVDPASNRAGDGRVNDSASSTPTIAPDGSIFYGAYSRYNWDQGHLMHFASDGTYLGDYNFGWDSTVAIYPHGGTYSVVIKDNRYSGLGSYCDVDSICPTDRTLTNPTSPEAYFITQLSPSLTVEWRFQNTNTQSCSRNSDGSVTCVSDHPHGFEWCVNAPMIDGNGVVYANSEDGNLYSINQGGGLRQNIFQQLALGAAYTPTSIGTDGKIYSQNAGHLFVVGQ